MKYSELHKKIKRGGWKFLKQDSTSHRHYIKNGVIIVIPYHGAKEVGKSLEHRLLKQAGLK